MVIINPGKNSLIVLVSDIIFIAGSLLLISKVNEITIYEDGSGRIRNIFRKIAIEKRMKIVKSSIPLFYYIEHDRKRYYTVKEVF